MIKTATIIPLSNMIATVKFNEGGKIRWDGIIGNYGQAVAELKDDGYRVIIQKGGGKGK